MSTVDNGRDAAILRAWQTERLLAWKSAVPRFRAGPENVTALAYFFRPADRADDAFRWLECALIETWRRCGQMKTVVVTDRNAGAVEAFADRWRGCVEIQTEPALVPGDLNSMSVDCNAKLHGRFGTKYVLIVQDDGFPLREGLEDFLGKWDFLGSPMRRDHPLVNLVGLVRRHWPSNGGFSLRTKRMCEAVSRYWRAHYADRPFEVETASEDLFYTKTLPSRFPLFRWRMNVGNAAVGARFSYDGCLGNGLNFRRDAFGFHSARAFAELMGKAKR